MFLEAINTPADLAKLTTNEVGVLAQEIRDFLVENVSKTGGHLGPNLGVVELTIALHRVFNSPTDTIIFDTGHQSYVHKIITGRKDFNNLRSAQGLTGYPSRGESVHDIVENSHASTALSWAQGVAQAKKLKGDKSWTVAVIGDGALTGGMAWEALNNIADHPELRIVIVVNDNGRSYAPTIGGLANRLDALRTSTVYEKALSWGKKHLRSAGRPGEITYGALHGIKRGIKDFLSPQGMFSDLGIKYTGPVNGHDVLATELALSRAKDYKAPVIVHTMTEKGRGYVPAEQNTADHFHAIGPIHPETGLPVNPGVFSWTNIFASEMVKHAQENPRIVGITAAMEEPVGLKPFRQAFPDRVIDVGIAEQHALTLAAGLSQQGMHPVVALYATFLNRAFDQLLMDIALHEQGVSIILDRAGVTGNDGASHNGMWDLAMGAIIPGLRIATPRDGHTLRKAIAESLAEEHAPTLVRYPKGEIPADYPVIAATSSSDILFASPAYVEKITGKTIRTEDKFWQEIRNIPGKKTLFLALGAMTQLALEVAQELAQQGEEVLCLSPLWPIPIPQDILDCASSFDRIVTIEDGLRQSGLGSVLRDGLAQQGVHVPVHSFGLDTKFIATDSRENILRAQGLEKASILAKL